MFNTTTTARVEEATREIIRGLKRSMNNKPDEEVCYTVHTLLSSTYDSKISEEQQREIEGLIAEKHDTLKSVSISSCGVSLMLSPPETRALLRFFE